MSFLLQSGQRQGEDGNQRNRPLCSVRVFGDADGSLCLQVNQQRQKLHDLQTLIDNLGSSETVTDEAFEDRLKEAERAIMELLEEAQASKGKSRLSTASDLQLQKYN